MNEVFWWRIKFGDDEIQRLIDSVNDEHISQGPVSQQFESEFAQALNVPYAVVTTSGSVALLLSLMAVGVGKDDEVIVPNRTFIATAHAASMIGAKPILVDVRSDLPVMDVSQIRDKITSKTKAIILVHINGRSVDMAAIHQVADEYGLRVIEDACQAIFSKNASGFLGTQSDAGCFSLGMTKLLSTGQGGVVVTHSEKLYEDLKLLRNHGVTDTFSATYGQAGFNFKFTDMQAAIGLAQLNRVSSKVGHVVELYEKYSAGLSELDLPFLKLLPVKISAGEVPVYVEVLCQERESLAQFLTLRGIQTRPFHPDLHESPHLNSTGEFPNSRLYGECGMYLPSGPDQPLENVERVLEALYLYGRQRNGDSADLR